MQASGVGHSKPHGVIYLLIPMLKCSFVVCGLDLVTNLSHEEASVPAKTLLPRKETDLHRERHGTFWLGSIGLIYVSHQCHDVADLTFQCMQCNVLLVSSLI